jgi:hypothetical protein
MWRDAQALLVCAKAVGVIITLGCFFFMPFQGWISLRAMRERRWW